MSDELFKIVKEMDIKDIELQLALQCAPLIMNLKASNLLIIHNDNLQKVKQILSKTNISQLVLLVTEHKSILLLYQRHQLERYLSQKRVRNLLENIGYQEHILEEILKTFRLRYENYNIEGKNFPHEMGLLLEYPVGDVEGFMKNEGRNFLYSGYWKVYENMPEKVSLFCEFERAKERLVKMVSNGICMTDIINNHNRIRQSRIAV